MEGSQKKRVVVFGELLLRFTPRQYERFVQAQEFDARYTGAEANVAVSLSNFGMETFAVSKVPDHEIGQACVNYLRRFGVNTNYILRGGERLGIVYIEIGASQRTSKVIYDRSHTSFQEATPEEFDWKQILCGKDWFHFSGTAPSRGDNVVQILKEACSAAKELGLTISCDINYRSKLWTIEEARRVLPGIMKDVDVVICGPGDLREIFGISSRKSDGGTYRGAMMKLQRRFNLSWVAMILRKEPSASLNQLNAILYDGEKIYQSRSYSIQIVDRIGGGDAFTAGLIYGILSDLRPKDTIEFAAAASCLKHTIPGDFNLVSLEEIRRLLEVADSRSVER